MLTIQVSFPFLAFLHSLLHPFIYLPLPCPFPVHFSVLCNLVLASIIIANYRGCYDKILLELFSVFLFLFERSLLFEGFWSYALLLCFQTTFLGSQAQLTHLPGLFPQQLVLLLETAFLASLNLCPSTACSCTSSVHYAATSPDTAISFLSLWVASADNEPAADVEHSPLKVRGELGKHRQNQANLNFL